jgi:alpha-tubulin suppressor-like RCC1 family protein
MSNRHNLLLLNDSLYAWGKNESGQLGTGDKENRNFPININDNFSISTEIISYKTGRNHSLALDSTNRVWSWGANDMGQLGIGDTTDRTFPTEIAGYFPDGTIIEQISAGFSHSIALDSEGEIWTWGSSSYGELGTGDTRGKTKPHNISSNLPPGTRVVKIQAGNRCSFLIDSDGKVWCFGNNEHGQLGTGDTETRNIPTDISNNFPENTKIIDIKNGSNYSTLAIDSDNKIWVWGRNEMGELGTGNDDKYITPLNISNNFPTGTKITDISIGFSHSLALDSQNELWVWGDNLFGQLGIGRIVRESTLPKNISYKFPSDTKISTIYTGKYHNICEDTDGNVWS